MIEQLEFDWHPAKSSPRAALEKTACSATAPAPATVKPAALVQSSGLQTSIAAHDLHRELSESTGLRLRLRITNNSSTMMSVRYSPDRATARLSLHHMFLEAGPEVKRALVAWIKRPRKGKPASLLDQFIRERSHTIAPRQPRRTFLVACGRHHDLAAHFNQLNADYFEGKISARITWGRMQKLRRRYSIRFGSYSPPEDLIRMHPLLDQEFVPEFFVRYIVFHEMLHAHLGIEELASGRRAIHPPAFKRLEKSYPDYQRALAWMRHPGNLDRLLQAHRAR
ncbi:MAG: hypothetical protein HYZ00_09425 [Candidatus Hydrogenedentes bacterium]|nr:hypothetical protein [Candidatus Hydrogenedentota bacterium]